MDSPESVADAAVQILTQVATGVASTVGQTVTDLVRSRVAGWGPGEAALTGLAANPTDPAAALAAREVVRQVLVSDPVFTAQLTSALRGGPVHNTGSLVIQGSTLRGRQNISLGAQTITNIRNSPGLLIITIVVAIVVLAGLVYGGIALSGGTAHNAAPITDSQLLRGIPPDQANLPGGWQATTAQGPVPCPDQFNLCYGGTAIHVAGYKYGRFTVLTVVNTFGSSEDARAGYLVGGQRIQNDGNGVQPLVIPDLDGDESVAFGGPDPSAQKAEYNVAVKVGTVVITCSVASAGGDKDIHQQVLWALARAEVARAWEAQDGKTPSAKIEF
ncbi:hypothetical protein [Actinokineospora sp. NBRC 105648]|uniref:hypothetical protein n=1 Tax=Actinokineospora sp. NBRC 105648 TaxID=3032206 RepID=UPI0024A59A84|nr:hypothetical protein [Actinokineospora sp. NBRC 105648]GLZ43406.1 hypothetical protein Acsp05_70300 [Actinokineospora sp. NBRC 105648]